MALTGELLHLRVFSKHGLKSYQTVSSIKETRTKQNKIWLVYVNDNYYGSSSL